MTKEIEELIAQLPDGAFINCDKDGNLFTYYCDLCGSGSNKLSPLCRANSDCYGIMIEDTKFIKQLIREYKEK